MEPVQQIILLVVGILLLQLICLYAIVHGFRQLKRKNEPDCLTVQPVTQAAASVSAHRGMRDELAAVIAVAVAESLGTDVQGLRIHSIREI